MQVPDGVLMKTVAVVGDGNAGRGTGGLMKKVRVGFYHDFDTGPSSAFASYYYCTATNSCHWQYHHVPVVVIIAIVGIVASVTSITTTHDATIANITACPSRPASHACHRRHLSLRPCLHHCHRAIFSGTSSRGNHQVHPSSSSLSFFFSFSFHPFNPCFLFPCPRFCHNTGRYAAEMAKNCPPSSLATIKAQVIKPP
jgi:hypothetical protein